jgi:hypothetical protein
MRHSPVCLDPLSLRHQNQVFITIMKKIIYIGLFASLLTACTEEKTVAPVEQVNTTDPVNVLQDNSGFSHVYDDIMVLSSATAAPPSMGVLDFTVENNNLLHLAYYYSQPSQQDVFATNKRITKDLASKTMVALPAGADPLNYSNVAISQEGKSIVLEQFRPYSNFFTYATLKKQGNNVAQFQGDIDYNVPSNANPIGTPDMGWRFPCMNIAVNVADNAFGSFATGIPKPTYTLSSNNHVPFIFFNNSGKKVVTSFLESDIFTYGSFKAFFVRTDSLIAYNINNTATEKTALAGVALSGISGQENYVTRRHYSTDGNILGMLIEHVSSRKFTSASYNFTTGIMTLGFDNVALDYSGTGTDYDLDEFGNIYYTGYASNGANTNGVSIYKKSTSGALTLVGQDNFLKFGSVIKLKTLSGKVYIAVTGKKTGTSAYQLSIIKEN